MSQNENTTIHPAFDYSHLPLEKQIRLMEIDLETAERATQSLREELARVQAEVEQPKLWWDLYHQHRAIGAFKCVNDSHKVKQMALEWIESSGQPLTGNFTVASAIGVNQHFTL